MSANATKSTSGLGISHRGNSPASPPSTPTALPHLARKTPVLDTYSPLLQDTNIRPIGNGHQFSYCPAAGPTRLSPQSNSSSSLSPPASSPSGHAPASLSDDYQDAQPQADTGTEAVAGGFEASLAPQSSGYDSQPDNESFNYCAQTTASIDLDFIIEEVGSLDSDFEGLEVLRPSEVESSPSPTRSYPRDLDRNMMHDLKNLHCGNESTLEHPDDDHEAFLKRRRELKRIRRVSLSSSIGKRTHSELSDSELEESGSVDMNDAGFSARRMRKRLNRGSLLFPDPPEPRIEELEEPDSDDDNYTSARGSLAQELPFYATMEIMEIDSN
ncbi:hypothetical protein CDD81_1298 [Ophiocordyceps australis]|uniref:Uncharacterized protein n=1 Tax=Ophiocordyceps australis TaxID=1399860 RepID=A0A2C5Y049_9HYPO|nr:hypothetical protein CDD81_1298 [Ophiocordyceps australis]